VVGDRVRLTPAIFARGFVLVGRFSLHGQTSFLFLALFRSFYVVKDIGERGGSFLSLGSIVRVFIALRIVSLSSNKSRK
jgi:hypothetical protein